MRKAVVVDCLRTPIAKAHPKTGYYRQVRSEDLSAQMMNALVDRTGIDPHLIEDIRWGCVMQQGEQGFDVARVASLVADLPVEVAGVTINRNCGSSLEALNQCSMSVAAELDDIQIAGGVEHMEHIPMNKGYSVDPRLLYKHSEAIMQMGLTAEYLAMKYQISREQQDEFAARSHQLAAAATEKGEFNNEIIPTWGHNEEDQKVLMTVDQCIRPDTTVEGLAALKPVFNPAGGSVTAGNASPLNAGACAMLVMSEEKSNELGFKPMAKIVSSAVIGVEPCEMGIGPVPAIKKVLKRTGMSLDDIGAFELNEAFAVQTLSVMKCLGLGPEKVNTRGGAVAIGHPLGASGARIATTLLHRMRDGGIQYGLASMCIGQGQGIATIFELCD